jgi:hypothetical protein
LIKRIRGYLATYPPNPLPLAREGGVWVREGLRPSLKSLPPLLEKERGIKGVRLINNQNYGEGRCRS